MRLITAISIVVAASISQAELVLVDHSIDTKGNFLANQKRVKVRGVDMFSNGSSGLVLKTTEIGSGAEFSIGVGDQELRSIGFSKKEFSDLLLDSNASRRGLWLNYTSGVNGEMTEISLVVVVDKSVPYSPRTKLK